MPIFEKMGMYGLEQEEDFFLAGLVTGDPVLMIGTHGCGKNFFFERLAETLKLRFQVYDASKAMFEDILGFPDMKSLMEEDPAKRKIKYLQTPMSILDKDIVLVDEISRAHVQMQNKWLEVIRSRQVMGVKAPDLKWVWAAMNPLSYEGAVPLDEALAGRFAWIIYMPEAYMMDDADALQVAMNENKDDSTALSKWDTTHKVKDDLPTDELYDILKRAGVIYDSVCGQYLHAVANYTVRLMKTLSSKSKVNLDGRRMSMIRRNILSVIAVKKAKGESILLEMLTFDVLLKSMPNPATGREISPADLLTAHNLSKGALHMKKDVNYMITVEKDYTKKLALALEHQKEVTPMLLNEIIGTIARDPDYTYLTAVMAPIITKFARLFDMESITAVSDRMAKLTGKGEFDFTIDRNSVMAWEDFKEAQRTAKKSSEGIIAMRVTSHILTSREKQQINLEDITNMFYRVRERVIASVEQLRPAYHTLAKRMGEADHEQSVGQDPVEEESNA